MKKFKLILFLLIAVLLLIIYRQNNLQCRDNYHKEETPISKKKNDSIILDTISKKKNAPEQATEEIKKDPCAEPSVFANEVGIDKDYNRYLKVYVNNNCNKTVVSIKFKIYYSNNYSNSEKFIISRSKIKPNSNSIIKIPLTGNSDDVEEHIYAKVVEFCYNGEEPQKSENYEVLHKLGF